MRKPEPQRIDPAPSSEVANNDEDEASNDECDDGEVQREHHIGE